jgi:putative aldouronate transport system substrate-binding protein
VFDRGTDWGRSDPTNNNWTKWIQEKILKDENIAVTFVTVPRSQDVESLNTMMAAGNAPDVCFSYEGNLVNSFRSQGGLNHAEFGAVCLICSIRSSLWRNRCR